MISTHEAYVINSNRPTVFAEVFWLMANCLFWLEQHLCIIDVSNTVCRFEPTVYNGISLSSVGVLSLLFAVTLTSTLLANIHFPMLQTLTKFMLEITHLTLNHHLHEDNSFIYNSSSRPRFIIVPYLH